jgi:hypothetical protein
VFVLRSYSVAVVYNCLLRTFYLPADVVSLFVSMLLYSNGTTHYSMIKIYHSSKTRSECNSLASFHISDVESSVSIYSESAQFVIHNSHYVERYITYSPNSFLKIAKTRCTRDGEVQYISVGERV